MATAPYKLPAGQPPLPSGEFLLPVCTNAQRTAELLNALNFYLTHSGESNYEAVIDVYRALTYVEDPFQSPCLRGGLDCWDIYPDMPSITYEPQNPFTEPDYTPPGYQAPPFTWVKPGDGVLLALGFQVGDVVTDPTRFMNGQIPIPPDDFGFPRFRFSWTDRAEIELHFVQYPLGGVALITVDGNALPVQVVHLNKDLVSIPFETVSTSIVEIEVTTDGAHFIDVTFFPVINDELPFVGYGGGFRKITICQGQCVSDFDVRQNEETPCILEKTADGDTWEQFADLTLCLENSLVDTGSGLEIIKDGVATPIQTIPDDADPRTRARATRLNTESEIKCLASANAANVMQKTVEEAIAKYKLYPWYTAILILCLALSFAFGTAWGALAVPFVPAVAALLVLSSLTSGSFTSKEFREFACILYNNCTVVDGKHYFDFNAVKTAVVAKQPAWSFNVWNGVYAILDIIGEAGLNVAGDTTAITDTCCDFCSTGTQSTYLYLTAEPYFGSIMSKNANNNNLISKSANGLRMSANGNTLYFRWDFAFQVPYGTEVTELGVYMTNNGEPFTVSLYLNQVATAYRTYSNYRPFGQFHYSNPVTLLPGLNRLIVAGFNNNTTTGYFEIQRVYAVYRGCDPFLYYR